MDVAPDAGAQRVVLIGLRGSGKSTLGRELARRLARPFTDVDELVAQLAGRSADELLAQQGEPAFREVEARALRLAARQPAAVVATGGGAVLQAEAFAELAQGAFVVYLDAPVEVLAERAARRPRPPLTKLSPREELILLHDRRDPLYRAAASLVLAVGVPGAADPILALLSALQEEPAP